MMENPGKGYQRGVLRNFYLKGKKCRTNLIVARFSLYV